MKVAVHQGVGHAIVGQGASHRDKPWHEVAQSRLFVCLELCGDLGVLHEALQVRLDRADVDAGADDEHALRRRVLRVDGLGHIG